jgi:hypothetical protein
LEIYPCSRSPSTATPTNFPTCTEPKITACSYSLYRTCTPEHKITASACSLFTLVILDAAVTGGGGGIVVGVVVAIDVSKINSIIISSESINLREIYLKEYTTVFLRIFFKTPKLKRACSL